MELRNEFCQVTIEAEQTDNLQSEDKRHYDVILDPGLYSQKEFRYGVFSIHIDLSDREYTIALIGDDFSQDYNCAFLDGYVLTVMQNHAISQIDVRDAALLLYKEYECLFPAFSIFRVQKGYIVYGELEIVRLDDSFNKLWDFSGRDIFISASGKEPFQICDDRIKLFDFEDNYYEVDFDGNLISDIPAKG